jgi:hypothetical protein
VAAVFGAPMRHTIKPLLTTAILSALVAGCVAYVPPRHWNGHHGYRYDRRYDDDRGRRDWDRDGDWDHDRFDDRPRGDRRYR